ncbi:hypothetical protein [Massilia timonae]|uniref:hypothetical protein n=1 Tax=Massilia timonae TaxID=47229 RepID=UPI0028D8B0BF|nr:hypothetical protein [Massilia timonae]
MSKNTRNSTPAAVERANANHKSDQGNANRGTSGTNPANAKVHGNRGAQMNPNRRST